MKIGIVMVLGCVVLAARAMAVDKETFRCEDRSTAAIAKFAKLRAKCLVKCQQTKLKEGAGSTRVCSGLDVGFPDATTAECLAKTDDKLGKLVGRACPAGTLPACGSYELYAPNDAAGWASEQATTQGALLSNTTVPTFVCTVAADPDPKATLACEVKTVATLGKLAKSIAQCLSGCYAALQLDGDTSRQCTPDAVSEFALVDTTTATCLTEGIDKAKAMITAACPTLPLCGSVYFSGVDAVVGLVVSNYAGNFSTPATNPYCAP